MLPQAWHLGFTTAASLEQQYLTSPNIAKQSGPELQLTGILFTFTRRFWISIILPLKEVGSAMRFLSIQIHAVDILET